MKWKLVFTGNVHMVHVTLPDFFFSFNIHEMEVPMLLNIKVTAFWVVNPYSLVDMYQSFGRTCSFCLQGRV